MFSILSKTYLRSAIYLVAMLSAHSLFSEVREFQTIISRKEGKTTEYLLQTTNGTEQINPNPLNRLSILSEDQTHYPIPESGCGPTAMLSILIWYEKFGLIDPYFRDANLRKYKLKSFIEIDLRLAKQAGRMRTEELGTLGLDTAIVMDSIVKDRSKGALRIHTDIIDVPLKISDCLDTTKGFRSGYLVVDPKDKITGEFLGDHAAVFIRSDRTGLITLGTWGQHYHGRLKKRADGQWFIPQNQEHMELKVKGLMRFIPYTPEQ